MTLRHFTGTDMADAELQKTIEDAWEARTGISTTTTGAVREAVETALELLDSGKERVAEKGADGNWGVNQWLK
jgi:2,3,4,5-tetrahydropyridine-2-carboxylate N-succinyltransferase